jgi:hypothetical protein
MIENVVQILLDLVLIIDCWFLIVDASIDRHWRDRKSPVSSNSELVLYNLRLIHAQLCLPQSEKAMKKCLRK